MKKHFAGEAGCFFDGEKGGDSNGQQIESGCLRAGRG